MSTTGNASGFGITAANLRAYDWQAILAAAVPHECLSYYEIFAGKTKTLPPNGNDQELRVYSFLSAVASFWPNYHSDEKPFRPMMVLQGGRSPIPDDLSKTDLDALREILGEIRDPEFRARVADVLWICRKDYKAAQTAVDAYIESSKILETGEMWPPFAERLQRAMQVGAQIGRVKAYHQKAISAVEEAIVRHETTEDGLLCARLMHLLLHDNVGEPKKYSAISETLAKRMGTIPNWNFSRDYWQLKAAWDLKDGKPDAARTARLQTANTYVKLAESFVAATPPSFMGASGWMQKAVQALREAKADPGEIEAAHLRLLDYQRKSMSEMETVQITLENAPEIESKMDEAARFAAKQVSGRSFEDAIFGLVSVAEPSNPEELRKRVENPNSGGVFTQIFGTTTVRPGGQTSDTRPPLDANDPEEREEAVLKEMYSQARTVDWNVRVRVFIDPGRQQIIAEHAARPIDLMFLVQDNPFVPNGREGLFLRGLHAGLHGDLVMALHFLLPQIENSIREIFISQGVITSKLESDQTQDEHDLGWMLVHPEMARIFGAGMAFDLRGLLVERFGLNLRNDMAHGLLAESQMVTEGALYAWWLTLRLCCLPIVAARKQAATK